MQWRKRLLLLGGFLVITAFWALVLAVLPAWSFNTYYAQPSGPNSDCNAAKNLTTPIGRTADGAHGGLYAGAKCLASGDTLVLLDGTYHEGIYDLIPQGVDGNNYTTVKALNKRQAVLDTFYPGGSAMIMIGINASPFPAACGTGTARPFVRVQGLKFDTGLKAGGSAGFVGDCGPPWTAGVAGTVWGAPYYDFFDNEVTGGCNTYSVSSFSTGLGLGGNTGFIHIKGNWFHDIGIVECNGNPIGSVPPAQWTAFSYAMYLSGGDMLIEENEIGPNISAYGIHGYSTGDHFHRNVIRNNWFHDIMGPSILACGSENQIYNNLITQVGDHHFHCSYAGSMLINGSCQCNDNGGTTQCFPIVANNNLIYNNTFVRNNPTVCAAEPCITLGNDSGGNTASNNVLRNNICWNNKSDAGVKNINPGNTGNVLDHNLCNGGSAAGCSTYSPPSGASIFEANIPAGSTPTNNLSAQGITAQSFKLSATSPAINAGVSTASGSPTFTMDYGGQTRLVGPAQDQGAWEFGGTPAPSHKVCGADGICTTATGTGTDECTTPGNACPLPTVNFTALHWPLDECSGTTVADTSTGNNVTGTLSSSPAPTWLNPGHSSAGCALSFVDGATTVSNAGVSWQPGQPGVSVTFWIRTHPPLSGQPICSGGGCGTFSVGNQSDPNRFDANVPWSDNVLYFSYGNNASGGVISYDFTAYLGQWTFVALVSNGTNFKGIYLNAQLKASGTTVSAPTAVLTGVTLGATPGPRYANADIDDFQIVNRVLTQAEIAQMYGLTRRPGRHGRLELK